MTPGVFTAKNSPQTKPAKKMKIENSNVLVSVGDVFLHTKKIGYRLTKGY